MADEAWTDQPIRSGDEDTLGRTPYARRAAELIVSTHSFDSSAVFGLSGPWGSGKTSLVNLIVKELKKAHPEWKVARFTPWATSDVSGLLDEFHASLAEVLPKRKGRHARRALSAIAKIAAPAANLLPVAGASAAEGLEFFGNTLAKAQSWEAAFGKASAELKRLREPILIVVDDIDRLQADELMTLLKVVRLLGRFDGVQYLLAYDDESLYRNVGMSHATSSRDGSAERFVEKIVQYPLFVPPLLRHQQLARLNTGLLGVRRDSPNEGEIRRLDRLTECFVSLLKTPRAIDRYVGQLRHHIPLLPPDEVDDDDVQLLTLVRVSFPALFNALPHYRDSVISGHTGKRKEGSYNEYEVFKVEELLDLVPHDLRGVARRLLVSLFPNLRTKNEYSVHGSRRRQSVHNNEYFDRYFAMGILDYDIGDAIVSAAVEEAIAGSGDALTRLLVGSADDIRGLVLSKATDPKSQPTEDAGRIRLAEILVGISNEIGNEDDGPFGVQGRVLGWIADLLSNLANEACPSMVDRLMAMFRRTSLRIIVWDIVESEFGSRRSEELPAWYSEYGSLLARVSIDEFLIHLKQGDAAESGDTPGYQLHFALQHDVGGLRAGILKLLMSGDVDVSHLASRLVSVRTIAGISPDWQLSPYFDQEIFNRLAPPDEDPWYEIALQEVDPRDLGWANRRKFVAGRVTRPPALPAGPGEDLSA